jgi:hypothetical protein
MVQSIEVHKAVTLDVDADASAYGRTFLAKRVSPTLGSGYNVLGRESHGAGHPAGLSLAAGASDPAGLSLAAWYPETI